MIFKNKKAILSVSFLVFQVILFFSFVSSADALTLSPPRFELEGDKGSVIQGTVKLFNEGQSEKTFYVTYENFEAKGETGTPSFVPGTTDLATWITTEPNIIIKPGEEKLVKFAINIPNDAEAGGHFAAIFWSTTPPPKESTQLSIGAKIGTLVLLRVRGNITEEGGVLEFGATNHKKYYNSLPIEFYYRFQNAGNDRVKPAGIVKIKNMFGFTANKLSGNPQEGNILPHSIRRIMTVWGDDTGDFYYPIEEGDNLAVKYWKGMKREWHNFAFGRYKAILDIIYGSTNKETKSSFVVWVFPWRLTTTILIFLIIIFWFGRHEIRKYNEYIISRAMKHMDNLHETIKTTFKKKV